ncbi:MAG: Mov34/MPN/PAD-1 family protein [Promethearchaeota archaeon]
MMKLQQDIILVIRQDIFESLKKCVQKASPNESFGLIFGPKPKEIPLKNPGEFQYHYIAEVFECIKSDRSSPVDFLMENIEELYRVISNANKKYDARVLSIFHSHPAGSYPSGFDINYMKHLDNFYRKVLNSPIPIKIPIKNEIWTIMDGSNFDLNGFLYLENEIQQIQLRVE